MSWFFKSCWEHKVPLIRISELHCPRICVYFFPLELFLIVSPSRPIEGNTMTLTCKTQPPPQKLDAKLQFLFYKDGRALGPALDSLPEFRIPVVRKEDSGSYWCQAKITSIKAKLSRRVQIEVHSECQWGPLLGWAKTGRDISLVFPDYCVLLLHAWMLFEACT